MGKVIKINPREGNKFYQNGQEITYDSPETKSLVNQFFSAKGWSTKQLSYILKTIGIKTPVVISKNKVASLGYQMVGLIDCLTADGKKAIIHLLYHVTDIYDFKVEIDNVLTSYSLSCAKSKDDVPVIYILDKAIDIDGERKLYIHHEGDYLNACIKMTPKKEFDVSIDWGTDEYVIAGKNDKYQKLEEYILNLTDYTNVIQIYNDISEILELPNFEKNELFKVIILNKERTEDTIIVRNGLVWNNQKISQFIYSEGDETYNLSGNNSWEYYRKNVKIVYDSERDLLQLEFIGKEEQVFDIDIKKTVTEVNEKVRVKYQVFKK